MRIAFPVMACDVESRLWEIGDIVKVARRAGSDVSGSTTNFTFYNQHDRPVELVVEPWAIVEEISGGGTATFEVNASPPPEIEFSLTEQGQAYVYVMSEQVKIIVDGVKKHDFKTTIRPPLAAFRVLNKLLFSS